MLRIRFHGRGGQGMKTASRIVGTAAFLQGYHAQDSPLYGAERRGAPMAAFTRFDDQPVLERGFVATPDIVVIADETLLDDPLVRPLQGLRDDGVALINSVHDSPIVRQSHAIPVEVVSLDFTSLALRHTGSVAALSVALGAATAKIAGLRESCVEQAVRDELQALAFDSSRLDRNLELARTLFSGDRLRILQYKNSESVPRSPKEGNLVTPVYRGGWAGAPSVAAAPNTPYRKTGDWRVQRPVIDLNRCTHCWICFVNCPDGAIALDAGDVPHIDYGVCKGCLLCVEECPIDVIASVREAEASCVGK